MNYYSHAHHTGSYGPDRLLLPGIVLIFIAAGAAIYLLFPDIESRSDANSFLFLLPWIAGLSVVLAFPSFLLYRRGEFSFANPLVFATYSYFFPAFVLGGVLFAFGLSEPYYLFFIQDARNTLPLTVVLIGLGFLGLTAGYFLPLGRRLGEFIAGRLPLAECSTESLVLPGLLLLFIGFVNTIAAFSLGIFGYQKVDVTSTYDGLIFMTTLFWIQASFLLWYVIFSAERKKIYYIPILALLIATSLAKSLFAGNRGSVLQVATIIVLAYILCGRQFKVRQVTIATLTIVIGLAFGMVYGTTFRQVKGGEFRQDLGSYSENILETFDQVNRSDLSQSLSFSVISLAERLDIISTVAVVVSNHEQLKPFEESLGLNDNIWTDMTTFFIPRVVWNDKPAASDARKYSDLYFDYGESSFAITPMGDLLRNFGVIGIPIGMMILGIILRIMYRALVENQPVSMWRSTLYFMLLTSVSYEGFYATIIPNIVKVGLTSTVGVLLIVLIARRVGTSGSRHA